MSLVKQRWRSTIGQLRHKGKSATRLSTVVEISGSLNMQITQWVPTRELNVLKPYRQYCDRFVGEYCAFHGLMFESTDEAQKLIKFVSN